METLCSGPGVYSCATACSCRMSLRRPARVADLHACVRRCQPSSSLPHLLGALLVIVLLAHLALVGKARDVVPPLPGLPTLVGQLEHAQLPQVLLRGSARSPSGQPGTCTARCPAASSHELSTLPSADGPPPACPRARARPCHGLHTACSLPRVCLRWAADVCGRAYICTYTLGAPPSARTAAHHIIRVSVRGAHRWQTDSHRTLLAQQAYERLWTDGVSDKPRNCQAARSLAGPARPCALHHSLR